MKEKKRIFWAGDSTVATNKISTFPQTGIGQVFYLYLKDNIEVCNFARNGRSSKSFIDEGLLDEIREQMRSNDFLFIQFGHNDEKKDKERRTEAFSTYEEYLMKYIHAARCVNAYPVLITSVYRRLFDENGNIKDKVHLDYPDSMISLAKRENIPCIDLCDMSKKLLQETGDEASKKWFMNIKCGEYENYKEGLKDNTHLKYEGAVKMAGFIAEKLKEFGGVYKDLIEE